MTREEFKSLGLPVQESDILCVESGLEWLKNNTTLEFAPEDMESIRNLPSGAKLFLVKFCEVVKKDVTVSGESMGTMSQSFSTESGDKQLRGIARQLLKPYLNPTVRFLPCKKRWDL